MITNSGVPHEEFYVLAKVRTVKLGRKRYFDLKNQPEYLGDDRNGNAYYKTTRDGAREMLEFLFLKRHGMEASFKQFDKADVPSGLTKKI